MNPPAKLLTIGGSDSGGAAGIQADLKTWTTLGCYGMSALTVVTAQNSVTVAQAQFHDAAIVQSQIRTVLSDYGADGIKLGMIGQVELVEPIAAAIADNRPLIVDPVLVNHKGEPLFSDALLSAYRHTLLPLATVVTPNLHEAQLLAGMAIDGEEALLAALQRIHAYGSDAVLVKRWPTGGQLVDVLYDGSRVQRFAQPPVATGNTHGSGDALSAALLAYLVRGMPLAAAVAAAQRFVRQALVAARSWQLGSGHGPLALLCQEA